MYLLSRATLHESHTLFALSQTFNLNNMASSPYRSPKLSQSSPTYVSSPNMDVVTPEMTISLWTSSWRIFPLVSHRGYELRANPNTPLRSSFYRPSRFWRRKPWNFHDLMWRPDTICGDERRGNPPAFTTNIFLWNILDRLHVYQSGVDSWEKCASTSDALHL
jgi:hypothetical protein